MSDIDLTNKIDLTKVTVGTFANLGGQPVDYAKSQVLNRAGVPSGDPRRTDLVYTHASVQGKAVPRLPDPFPPDVLPEGQKLQSAQDYLDLIAATPPEFIPTAAEMTSDKAAAAAALLQAQQAEQEAAQKQHEAAQREQEAADAAKALESGNAPEADKAPAAEVQAP